MRKLQDVRGVTVTDVSGINIVLTNPGVLESGAFISTSSPCSEEDEREGETSQERTSYRCRLQFPGMSPWPLWDEKQNLAFGQKVDQ